MSQTAEPDFAREKPFEVLLALMWEEEGWVLSLLRGRRRSWGAERLLRTTT